MASKEHNSSVIPTLMLILFLCLGLGVLLMLLFGWQARNASSTVNNGASSTTASRPVDTNANQGAAAGSNSSGTGSTTSSTGSTTSSTATTDTTNSASNTPIEGEAASGSVGAHANDATAPGETPLLEQTVTDTSFKGTGAEIYVQACQSCHMPGGKGGQGAGNYPKLAGNPKLKTAAYPITLVLHGNGGMPGFGHYMNDEQISEVVNYIRSELNDNTDKVKPEDIKQMRQPGEHYMIFGEAAG